ncbi:sushi, von Willebrand factor type A, EGF and pentraxin domain-containing protein 1-like isoform X3 [Lytechinus variegatus]|uniref:sushi, von Willebrand factor type A, EGF and pentraxin domain-containing protein 1-like isoform X3 n=1 Tax=Lytechinus variegatus TaxID=7654 RepID=UPI001BB1F049|nr:sushi, von Willebrand factor type A, EGF and pentraxin domain-containing protein 1-like isoform X3 [Lytechinus variegatus]
MQLLISFVVPCLIALLSFPANSAADSGWQSHRCGAPSPLKHGTLSIIGEGLYASFACNQGFSLYGSRKIRCLGNGQWSAESPICVATGCSPLPKFPKGRTSTRMDGAVVVYKCPKRTWIRGSKTIFCNGERWNDTVPTCKGSPRPDPDFLPISNCPLPPQVHSGVAVKGFEYVTYTCINRTVPTLGSGVLRCLSNGEWDRQPVVCAKPGCPRLTEPPNGLVIEKFGLSVLEFRCFLNFHLLGPSILFCDGQRWNGTAPSCVQELPPDPSPRPGAGLLPEFTVEDGTSCGQSRAIRHGQPSYSTELDDRGNTYWAVEYICDPGYRVLMNDRLFCSAGVWIGELPQCVAFCGINNGGCSHYCLSINGRATCTCRPGYRLHINGRSCNDVNECAPNSGRGPCAEFCNNLAGGFACRCQRGYRLNEDGHSCSYQPTDPCSRIRCAYGTCVSVNGSASCQCPRGFVLSRDLRTCQECGINTYVSSNGKRCLACPDNSRTDGSGKTSIVACVCEEGYEKNPGTRSCDDINECTTRNGGCQHLCENTDGSYFCKCMPGYTLDTADQHSCIEIDECALMNNGGCQHECRNSPGSYSCTCMEGYAVDPYDRYRCTDVDECSFDSSRCEHVCINTEGGFYCECNSGYTLNGDGRMCTADVCLPLSSPANGRVNVSCNADGANTLLVGSRCAYECDAGFGLKGETELSCLSGGQWSGAPPTCVRVQCSTLAVPENGRVTPEGCRLGPSSSGSVCRFSCSSGFNLLGRGNLRCNKKGVWSNRAPLCSRDALIRCADDVTTRLPRGNSEMTIDLPEPDHLLDMVNATHSMTGHLFGVGQTAVTFTAYSIDHVTWASCTMMVTVIDKEKPRVVDCPRSQTIKTEEQYMTSLEVPEPIFIDNVGVVNITRIIEPSGLITWGTYEVQYFASDSSGNTASCTTSVTVQALSEDCGILNGPLNGNHFCTAWLNGQICQPTCLPGFYFFDGPLTSPTYICGRDGRWDPAKKAPDCTVYSLVGNSSVPCAPGKEMKDYPALGGVACMDCPRGMYSSDLGPATQPICKPCPQGLYQDRPGQISCLACPTGTTTTSTGTINVGQCRSKNTGLTAQGSETEPQP